MPLIVSTGSRAALRTMSGTAFWSINVIFLTVRAAAGRDSSTDPGGVCLRCRSHCAMPKALDCGEMSVTEAGGGEVMPLSSKNGELQHQRVPFRHKSHIRGRSLLYRRE